MVRRPGDPRRPVLRLKRPARAVGRSSPSRACRHGSTSVRTATCRSTATTTPRSTSRGGLRRCPLLPDPVGTAPRSTREEPFATRTNPGLERDQGQGTGTEPASDRPSGSHPVGERVLISQSAKARRWVRNRAHAVSQRVTTASAHRGRRRPIRRRRDSRPDGACASCATASPSRPPAPPGRSLP